MYTSLKNHLVYVLQEYYLSNLKNAYTGYATKSTFAILTYLYSNYICIYATGMAANDERLRLTYKSEELLKSLFKRLNECIGFAAASGVPVTYNQLVRIAYGLVANTGQYPEDCQAGKAVKEKSWTAFHSDFIESQADLCERQ